MSEHAVTPEKVVTIGGKSYVMRGTMQALKDIQQHFDKDVYDIAAIGWLSLRWDELAWIIAAAIGKDAPALEAIEADVVQVRGLEESRYLVGEWLVASVSPNPHREKNVGELQALIARQRKASEALLNKSASRGKATRASA